MFDEKKYPIAYRFNAVDCSLSEEEKKTLVFLSEHQSKLIWDQFIPIPHLMHMKKEQFSCIDSEILDFKNRKNSDTFFKERLSGVGFLVFFWSRACAALVDSSIFIKGWDDFFYPSDENSIALLPERNRVFFSFGDRVFYGDLKAPELRARMP